MPADFPSQMVKVMLSSWRTISQLWYYWAAGIFLAAWLGQAIPSQRLQDLFQAGRITDMASACLLGMVSPLCTYGTVPVLLQLLRGGVSPAPLLSFLVASSLLNPQLFILMLGALGPLMALAQLLSVALLSMSFGTLSLHLDESLLLNSQASPQRARYGGPGGSSWEGDACLSASQGFSWAGFVHRALSLTESVGLYFVLGVVAGGALEVFVPARWIVESLGAQHPYSVLVASVLGVPFYACGGGAIPTVKTLLGMGMSQGAALAFLVAGPATRVTALSALASVLSRRALALYIIFILIGATGMGYLFNLLNR